MGDTEDCVENTPYDDAVCVYNDGSLWNEKKEFEMIHNECFATKAIYQFRRNENVSYALYYDEYYKYVDSVERSGKWIIALDDGVSTEVAQCEEHDLMKCGRGNWKVVWDGNDDSLQLIVDETMSVENGGCQTSQGMEDMESSAVFVCIGLVLSVIALALCGFFMYRHWKKVKLEKCVVVEDDSEDEVDDAVVEVEVERTNLTETNE